MYRENYRLRTNLKVAAILREKQMCCITLRGAHCTVGRVFATVAGCVPEIRFWDLGDCVREVRLFNIPKYTRQKIPVSSIFCCNTHKRWL